MRCLGITSQAFGSEGLCDATCSRAPSFPLSRTPGRNEGSSLSWLARQDSNLQKSRLTVGAVTVPVTCQWEVVSAARFELAASSPRTMCSSKLSYALKLVRVARIELATSRFQTENSTAELHPDRWCLQQGSNLRRSRLQRDALPAELQRQLNGSARRNRTGLNPGLQPGALPTCPRAVDVGSRAWV